MNWCFPTSSEVIKCGKWLCCCGHWAKDHTIYDEDCWEDVDDGSWCSCKKFEFYNNNDCTVECQMKYLIEANK